MEEQMDSILGPRDIQKEEVTDILKNGQKSIADGTFDTWFEENKMKFNLKVN